MARLICLCNRITTNRIENFLKKFPQAELSDVMQSTAASTSCGRCRRELESFVRQIKGKHENKSKDSQLTIPFDYSFTIKKGPH